MIPWQLLDSATVPGVDTKLFLYQRGGEFSIRVDGVELMNSRAHGSEDALAQISCARIASRPRPLVLVGGLGMGYTLASALHSLGPAGRVVVAELVPAVVAWNRGPLAALAGHPLDDGRVMVREVDVAQLIMADQATYDAILLDIDNGPQALTRPGNDWLYTQAGLEAAFMALRPCGVYALWSASFNQAFTRQLHGVGFEVDEQRVRVLGSQGGGNHMIWLATRPA